MSEKSSDLPDFYLSDEESCVASVAWFKALLEHANSEHIKRTGKELFLAGIEPSMSEASSLSPRMHDKLQALREVHKARTTTLREKW